MGYTYRIELYHGSEKLFDKFDNNFLGSSNGNTPTNRSGFNFIKKGGVYGGVSLVPKQIYTALSFGKYLYKCVFNGINDEKIYKVDAKGLSYSQFKHELNDIMEFAFEKNDFEIVIIDNYIDAGILSIENENKVFDNTHIIINKKYTNNIIINKIEENKNYPQIYPMDFY